MYSLGPLGSGCPFPALPGLPGSSTDLFLRAVPNHPGRSDECLLIASPPITGFIIFGRLATSTSVTRPNQVHLRYGSQVCFPGFRRTDRSVPLRFSYMYERAIYMVNSFQFTRSARLSLVFQRTQRRPRRTIRLIATNQHLHRAAPKGHFFAAESAKKLSYFLAQK
jgi:hypothetical protein